MVWKNDQVSERETGEILRLARKSLGAEGDFVELGCYKGDTSLALAEILQNSSKKLWLYDSFEGLPEKRTEDQSSLGENFRQGALGVTKQEVKKRFLRAGLKVPIIKKAWFSELGAEDLPDKIALAFLDGDFYASIRDSLRLIEYKMVSGGIIIVHDYKNVALPGVKLALDQWLKTKNYRLQCFETLAVVFVI